MGYRKSTALAVLAVAAGGLVGVMASATELASADRMSLASSAPPRNPAPAASQTSALVFVQDRHLGESLGWLGYQVASRTVAFTTLVDAVGKPKAQEIVQEELQYLQPQYQQEWDRNLAAAYSASFTPEELAALDAGDPTPDIASKFRAKQRDVGMDMKGRSSELLKVYVSTALDNALKKAKP